MTPARSTRWHIGRGRVDPHAKRGGGFMIEIKKIVCPTDFSDFSRRALDHALALAKWYEAEVSVLHVIPRVLMPPEAYPYLTEPIFPHPRGGGGGPGAGGRGAASRPPRA